MARALDALVEAHRKGLRAESMRLRVGSDELQIEEVVLHRGDDIKRALRLLNLRKNRAETLTRRIHLLFCALAAARVRRRDGWVTVKEIAQLDGWSGGPVAKLLINEFELAVDHGILEQHGRGADAWIRLRMPASLIEIGDLPPEVLRLFAQDRRRPTMPPTDDVVSSSVWQPDVAVELAGALRGACRDRTLMLRPLYQVGGREVGNRSLVFGGLELRALQAARGQPAATSVLVKLPLGLTAGKELAIDQDALDAEAELLAARQGWPGLPARIERAEVQLDAGVLDGLRHRHGVLVAGGPLAVQALIVPLGHPRTAEAEPRLLTAVIDATPAAPRRLTRRDIHNVLILAERLAMLIRLLHRERRAHRHLSVDAIVLRYELGIVESVLAADLAASVEVPDGADELLLRDLFDLGRVLAHMITGWRLSEARQDFEPPFRGRDNIRNAVAGEGETVARLLFAVSRYLLESSTVPGSGSDEPASVALLDQFLLEIQHIHMLHWSRARGVPERRVSGGASSDPAPSDVPRKDWPRSAADPVATRLVTISHLVDLLTLQQWCERYITRYAWHDSLPAPGENAPDVSAVLPSAKRCIAILQRGFGRSAAREMWTYLWNADREEPVENLLRVLRNYVIHWAREQRFDVRHDLGDDEQRQSTGLLDELRRLASRFGGRAEPERGLIMAWFDELMLRVPEAAAARADPGEGASRREAPGTADGRLQSWQDASALVRLLRAGTSPGEKNLHDLEAALRGRSSPETVFWHILLARGWVANGRGAAPGEDESPWDKAMRTVLTAAGVAAARKLPFELAATLSASAHLTRVALATAELRRQVIAQGADEDSVRVQAAECALTAADAYLWLDNQQRHCRSLLEAVKLLAGCVFPERLVQALQLLSLARNHRLLDWQPPQMFDGDPRERSGHARFERYEPAGVPAAVQPRTGVRLTDFERALYDDVHRAWSKVRRWVDPDDPGTAIASNYFARHAPHIEDIVEAAAPQIEIDGGGLLDMVRRHYGEPELRRVLDLGCGAGDEACRLARSGRYEVWAVDSQVWFAVAPRAVEGAEPGPQFFAVDPIEYAREVRDGARPAPGPSQVDVVLLRCALGRVSRRDLLLAAAYELLRPGGLVVAVDWVQTRTTDRITWSRLLSTVRVVDVDTGRGYQLLAEQAGFAEFQAWDWRDVAAAVPARGDRSPRTAAAVEDLQMHRYFQRRLDATRDKLEDERSDARRSPIERAFLMRSRRDLEVLTAMSHPRGSLDWMYWAARRPAAPGGGTPG
jgi:SAM-dependent methyltransferase